VSEVNIIHLRLTLQSFEMYVLCTHPTTYIFTPGASSHIGLLFHALLCYPASGRDMNEYV